MSELKVDLYSDTQSRPTQAMREFMARAEVGDEQRGEDPTTNRLAEMVTGLLGKEAAVFLPSGTMCNEIAYRVHCEPGDEIILDKTGHAPSLRGRRAGRFVRSHDPRPRWHPRDVRRAAGT